MNRTPTRSRRTSVIALAATAALAAGVTGCGSASRAADAAMTAASPTHAAPAPSPTAAARASTYPLRGLVIALDPGHQLGNHNFPRQINRLVPAGGFRKPCDTTGTATNSGVPEASVNWRLSNAVARRLTALGAVVRMTRTSNSQSAWGPCVDARGAFGGRVHAVLKVSLHADGAPSGDYGFHVIVPTKRAPWTTRTAGPSLRLGRLLRDAFTAAGLPRSSYIGHGTALDVRPDIAGLNLSTVPAALIEIGNMRNAADAHRMTTRAGLARYADAVVRGIRAYLGR